VVFWPNIDPDIPSHPYCRKCLDEQQIQMLTATFCKGDEKAARAMHKALQKDKQR